ncbi:class I SAM-dependent methyltransferase [Cyclobacterium sp. SYSU L10401]|uniref:class I SAM-dependent methyltransferase n=1 Tax=Cyclobacterium sp. SYSU L10401 TaxID=2678657 RepID=UPI001F0999A0|nr:class I SAM-dependent methyltransferase [Cyclobacterium sp. SYSU L10401]
MVVKDHAISKESFIICACKNCQLWFTNPRPDEKNIAKYYNGENYISHQNKNKGITDLIYRVVRKYTLRQKLKQINSRSKHRGKLLDYGCGLGNFVKVCQENGWTAYGMEPNEQAAQIAINQTKINLIKDLTALETEKKFDVITLFHVLEHIHQLNKTVKVLLSKLKKRGLLFIAVPNRESQDATYFKENWAALDVPRHLYHFNETSMKYLAEKNDCRITEILPMTFDSYYVSLLSHQYSGSDNNYLKALKSGYLSNKAAKKNNNYSSLLFIIKKK